MTYFNHAFNSRSVFWLVIKSSILKTGMYQFHLLMNLQNLNGIKLKTLIMPHLSLSNRWLKTQELIQMKITSLRKYFKDLRYIYVINQIKHSFKIWWKRSLLCWPVICTSLQHISILRSQTSFRRIRFWETILNIKMTSLEYHLWMISYLKINTLEI